MAGFEQGFADTERAATLTAKSAAEVAKAAKALERAAKTGTIAAVRKAQGDLSSALGVLRQEVANATGAWPFQPEGEEAYLKDNFAAELRQVAAARGLDIHEKDGRLIAPPSIVRVLPGSRAVRIDRKQVSAVRPSHLAGLLVDNQKKPARFNTRNFLESVHNAYQKLTRGQSARILTEGNHGPTVPFAEIYDLFTVPPGAAREYSRTDFARDLYRLETEGPKETRQGKRIYFHSGRISQISFVDRDGHTITYHSVEFSGGK